MIHRSIVRAFFPGGAVLTVEGSVNGVGLNPFKGVRRSVTRVAVALARLPEPVENLPQHEMVRLESTFSGVEPQAGPALLLFDSLLGAAAVLADRMSRGLMHIPEQGAIVMATCSDWLGGSLEPLDAVAGEGCLSTALHQSNLGEVLVVLAANQPDGDRWAELIRDRHPQAKVHLASSLQHFSGNAFNAPRLRQNAKVFFPVLGAPGHEALYAVRVVVSEISAGAGIAESIVVVGTANVTTEHRAKQVIDAVRRLEPPSARLWQTVVELPQIAFDGGSFELATVVADRIARGREWPGSGRVIASGSIDVHDIPGRVLEVENELAAGRGQAGDKALEQTRTDTKTALLAREVLPYDTILLPKDGQDKMGWPATAPKGLVDWSGPQVIYVDRVPDAAQTRTY